MNWRTTIVLLVIVVALSLFVGLYERKLQSTDEARQAAKRVVPGLEEHREKVSRIVIERPRSSVKETDTSKNGPDTGPVQRVELKRTATDVWRITSPIAYPADMYRARGIVSALIYLEKRGIDPRNPKALAIRPQDGGELNPADFHLDQAGRIRVACYGADAEGTEEKLLAEIYISGQKLLGGDALYAALPASIKKEVYVVGASLFS
ncbi:MAG TPA: hypothetical protein ENN09_02160, partial [Planctomycetes bacterium]|nr:hypothetical protein [Planctomycetota bacterium]